MPNDFERWLDSCERELERSYRSLRKDLMTAERKGSLGKAVRGVLLLALGALAKPGYDAVAPVFEPHQPGQVSEIGQKDHDTVIRMEAKIDAVIEIVRELKAENSETRRDLQSLNSALMTHMNTTVSRQSSLPMGAMTPAGMRPGS